MFYSVFLLRLVQAVSITEIFNPQVIKNRQKPIVTKETSVARKSVAGELDNGKNTPTGKQRYNLAAGVNFTDEPSPPVDEIISRMGLGAPEEIKMCDELQSLFRKLKEKLNVKDVAIRAVLDAFKTLKDSADDVTKVNLIEYLTGSDNMKRMAKIKVKASYIYRHLESTGNSRLSEISQISQLAEYILSKANNAKLGEKFSILEILTFTYEMMDMFINDKKNICGNEDYVGLHTNPDISS